MTDKKRRVLVFPIGGPGEIKEIDDGLEAMQALVGGGYIQMVPYKHGAEMVCDEEGKISGLPLNRPAWEGADVIAGQFFFIGSPDDEGACTSLTDEQIQKLKEEFDDLRA